MQDIACKWGLFACSVYNRLMKAHNQELCLDGHVYIPLQKKVSLLLYFLPAYYLDVMTHVFIKTGVDSL